MTARRYIVSGRVQGVGFRYFVETRARRLGLAGWVRNRADGTVEAVAAGSEEQLGLLRQDLEEGPSAARVSGVLEEPATFDGAAPSGFVVLPTAR